MIILRKGVQIQLAALLEIGWVSIDERTVAAGEFVNGGQVIFVPDVNAVRVQRDVWAREL